MWAVGRILIAVAYCSSAIFKTLVGNWTGILIKMNALVGIRSKAFETLGGNNSYKYYEIGWN